MTSVTTLLPVTGFMQALISSSHDLGTMMSAEPLWKRVPTRDSNGQLLSDFMMLIPGLKKRPRQEILDVIEGLNLVLSSYRHAVVYADLNLRLNVFWVSIKPIPGMTLELATAINQTIPEARLVADNPQARPSA